PFHRTLVIRLLWSVAYGGILIAQAVEALNALNPGHTPHTINYKFVARAKTEDPLLFRVRALADGNIASVFVYQNEILVGICHVRYDTKKELLDSSLIRCPIYGPPNEYPTMEDAAHSRPRHVQELMLAASKYPIEGRPIESPLFPLSKHTRYSIWMRIKPQFRDEIKPSDGLSVALFMSDYGIQRVAIETFMKNGIRVITFSLHHSVWVHEQSIDPLGWYFFVSECAVLSHGRFRIEMHLFDELRKCVMTVVQEALFQRVQTRSSKI
ncbi:hypothetical protein PRIPAC_81116, partial [Pristionchus pacificus]|uniref:Uncharacterized protein n=1 Tax=Pristionchus pacificus TaxID=54126 RepID=A0A2A6CJC7_PRIPA